MALLEVKNLGISFGGLRAVDDFNISVEKGQLYGLIGPNGAGKTTAFNLLTGVYKPCLLYTSACGRRKPSQKGKSQLPDFFADPLRPSSHKN